MLRSDLRKQLRKRRQDLSAQLQERAGNMLADLLIHSPYIQQHLSADSRVALYLSNDGEISPSIFCQYLWHKGIATYLPKLDGETLLFAHYTENATWESNRFGIPEPIDKTPLSGLDMTLVLLPLVGFDPSGGRLGMGGGFYDKTFASRKEGLPPTLVGLAHSCQEVDMLPLADWDVPLDAIATENQLIRTS